MTNKSKFMLINGKLTSVSISTKADYSIPSTGSFFSPVTNLIPGISSVSGSRVLIGDKSSTQAMTLVNREVPLVQSRDPHLNASFNSIYGKEAAAVHAKHTGTVSHVGHDNITVTADDGTVEHHELYNNYLVGRESYLHNTPAVKKGEKVHAGGLLATSNYSDKEGNLALGMNLKTALMPYRSYNFEDALVISEDAAKKLEAEQLIPIRLEIARGVETDKDRYISLFSNKYVNDQLAHIDSDGVVKRGTKLKHGDPVILAFQPKTLKSLDLQLGRLSRVLRNAFSDISYNWEYEHDGEVIDVSNTGKLITVTVKTTRPMGQADKLSQSFGAKGVVRIVPNVQMPQGEDGKPIDVLLNTMSVTSRIAPGLVSALAVGKVAQKKGAPIDMPQFVAGSAVEGAIDLLKKEGISDEETVYDPTSGTYIKVLAGPVYYTRLHHIAEDKISTRSAATTYNIDQQPSKAGTDEKSKRLGNLATTVALSNDAKAVLRDIATIRATKNDEFWTALKLGYPAPPPKVPFIFEKFIGQLQGAGVHVDQQGTRFNIFPQTDKDVEKLSAGAVRNPLTYKLRRDELIAEDGGLFDPSITGIHGDVYNHIDLSVPLPNPVSEDYIRKLLKLTKVKFMDKLGTGEIEKELRSIDVDEKLKETKEFIKKGNRSGRDDALKVHSFLTMLKANNLKPVDLLLTKVAVIPAQHRPILIQGDQVMSADVNELYKDMMLVNQSLRDNKAEDISPELTAQAKKKLYEGLKAIYGLGEPVSAKSKEKGFKGLLASALGLQGGSAKESMFQAKVVNKPVDLVGRGVLVPDAGLALNEASIPQDIGWSILSPFVIRRLVMQGIPAVKAKEFVEKRHELASHALQEELKDRPGIITRDPQLSKYNFQGYYLKLNIDPQDFSVKLNPLVFARAGADSILGVVKVYEQGEGKFVNIADVPVQEHTRQVRSPDVICWETDAPLTVATLTKSDNKHGTFSVPYLSKHLDKQLYFVEYDDNSFVFCTGDNTVMALQDDGTLGVTPTEEAQGKMCPHLKDTVHDIAIQSSVVAVGTSQRGRAKKPSAKELEIPLDYKFGLFLGMVLGDGWIDSDDIIYLAGSTAEKKECRTKFKELGLTEGLPYTDSYDIDRVSKNIAGNLTSRGKTRLTGGTSKGSAWFNRWLKSHIGDGALHKRIPSFSLNAPVEHLLGILDGLISTDGSVSVSSPTADKPGEQIRIAVSSSSVHLIDGLQVICRRLGLTYKVGVGKSAHSGEPAFAFSFHTPPFKLLVEKHGFTLTHTRKNKIMQAHLPLVKPRSCAKAEASQDGVKLNEKFKLDGELYTWKKISKVVDLHKKYDVYDITVQGAGTLVTGGGVILYQSDGDQLNIQVPASDEAKEEIKEKLLPDKNLIYHGNFSPAFVPSNESATGLFQSSTEDNKNKPIKYHSPEDVMRDFFLGKLNIGDRVDIS